MQEPKRGPFTRIFIPHAYAGDCKQVVHATRSGMLRTFAFPTEKTVSWLPKASELGSADGVRVPKALMSRHGTPDHFIPHRTEPYLQTLPPLWSEIFQMEKEDTDRGAISSDIDKTASGVSTGDQSRSACRECREASEMVLPVI